jgi:hypothetical protein
MPAERVLKLAYPYYVRTQQGRVGVACIARSGGEVREALLDPARVKKVLLAVEEGKNAILLRSDGVSVYLGDYRIDESGAVVSARARYYVVYESDHSYYADLDWRSAGEVIKEGGLELLRDVTARVKPCKEGGWRAYLYELDRWDKYCFDLATVFEILETNVHPYYGVMD